MNGRRTNAAIGLLVATLLAGAPAFAASTGKSTLAVMPLAEKGGGYGQGQIGSSATEWLLDEIVNSEHFRVIEHDKLEALLAEQNFQASGYVDAKTAAKAGQLAGAKRVVFGTVECATKQAELHTSASTFRNKLLKLPFDFGGARRASVQWKITVRVVDVTTGEIVFSNSQIARGSSFKVEIDGTGGGADLDETKAFKAFRPALARIVEAMTAKI